MTQEKQNKSVNLKIPFGEQLKDTKTISAESLPASS